MRAFVQTFVLAPESPKKYYVHNDIFRYQDDDLISESETNEVVGGEENPVVDTDQLTTGVGGKVGVSGSAPYQQHQVLRNSTTPEGERDGGSGGGGLYGMAAEALESEAVKEPHSVMGMAASWGDPTYDLGEDGEGCVCVCALVSCLMALPVPGVRT